MKINVVVAKWSALSGELDFAHCKNRDPSRWGSDWEATVMSNEQAHITNWHYYDYAFMKF